MKSFVYLIPFSLALAMTGCGSDEAEAVAVITSTHTCHLDLINGNQETLVRLTPGQLSMRGWAFDRGTMTAPSNVEVVLKDSQGNAYNFPGSKRDERPDVAKAYKKEDIRNAGFQLVADASALPHGIYSIMVKMSEGKRTVQCDIKKNLIFI
ncbi:hypothetical protein ACNFBT_12385 [Pseudomonas sp. NY15181]|uniref:hypothetical protein n=1 Tax=Pseudomonas sp. NY15181 TaxID=3400349 RepID=UPI003A88801B